MSRLTQDTAIYINLTCTGLSPSMISLPKLFHFTLIYHVVVLQPRLCRNIAGLGYFPFARHYSGNHYCFLFLRVLRCFSSPGLPLYTYEFSIQFMILIMRVSPFGDLRITGYLHLPEAYRSLSRPSSPSGAKAFTMCPL